MFQDTDSSTISSLEYWDEIYEWFLWQIKLVIWQARKGDE